MSSHFQLPTQDILGPGQWYTLHSQAKRAINEDKKKRFVEFVYEVRDDMRCDKCRNHMTEYLQHNPFEPYWNIVGKSGEPVGMFKWTWNFHNAVNSRLGKPIMDWETAYNLYIGSGITICTKGCEDNNISPEFMSHPKGISIVRALNDSVFYKGPNTNTKSTTKFVPRIK